MAVVLFSASDKGKWIAQNFYKNSNLDGYGICLRIFPSRTNLKTEYSCNSRVG